MVATQNCFMSCDLLVGLWSPDDLLEVIEVIWARLVKNPLLEVELPTADGNLNYEEFLSVNYRISMLP